MSKDEQTEIFEMELKMARMKEIDGGTRHVICCEDAWCLAFYIETRREHSTEQVFRHNIRIAHHILVRYTWKAHDFSWNDPATYMDMKRASQIIAGYMIQLFLFPACFASDVFLPDTLLSHSRRSDNE